MTLILIAFATLVAIALFVGVLLALVSHFFGVPADERVGELRSKLPGVNCGACGFKGCDDYAEALAAGNATPDRCLPGGASVAEALSACLGVEANPVQEFVAFVHCNRLHTPQAAVSDYEGMSSCKAAAMLYGGPEACGYACLGFGDCAAICPVGAICMRDGIAHIDPARCVGCGLCAAGCPKHVIEMLPKTATVAVMCNSRDKGAVCRGNCQNPCIGCKKCEKTCPSEAISVQGNLAVVDYEKCTRCGLCVDACPTGALKGINLSYE